jgi:2-(1,2-epoxy-1,2-dihydrophenyl)acetyl-CoA isomerase
MSEASVLSSTADGIMTITLNRPTVLNAMNADLLVQLGAAFATAKRDDAVRAVLLTGAGRGFCAGADLSTNSMRTGSDVQEMMRQRYHPIILMMRQFPKPIVGAINGTAAGGGMSLALACDIVLAGESATFLQAFTKIGLVPDCGSTWFLPRMAGDVRARALIMMADKIPARDALQYGLVWKVIADDALMGEARACAARLASMPTRAYDLVKQALAASSSNGLADQLELEARLQGQAVRTDDHREGVTAFLEKRPPVFTGR